MTDNKLQDMKVSKFQLFSSLGRVFWILLSAITLFFLVGLIVVLTLTKSDALVAIPLVKHQYFADVYNRISERGLKIQVELVDIPELNKGYIISQSPAPGLLVRPGHKVNLKVSRGIQFCKAPNLIGVPRKSVQSLLDSVQVGGKKANLKIGQIAFVPSKKEKYGIVLDQTPKPDERLLTGSPIHLLISTGEGTHTFRMANYKNHDIDMLYETFSLRDINVLYKVRRIKDRQKYGRVLDQYPRRGKHLRKGDQVTFVIGIFEEGLYHRVGYEVVRYRVRKAYSGNILEVYIEDNFPRRSRYKKKVKNGESILAIVRREGSAKITIESNGKILKTIKIRENTKR